MRENSVGRYREPIAQGLPVKGTLLLQIERELRKRVSASISCFRRDVLVSTGEHHGLKQEPVDFVDILNREAYHLAYPVVVEAVHHRNLEGRAHSRRGNVFSCFE